MGEVLLAVDRTMGLQRGQKAEVLGEIRVLSVRREPLGALLAAGTYGIEEMVLEGFPGRLPADFVAWLIGRTPSLTPETVITRIQFEHLVDARVPSLPATWPFPVVGH